VPRFEVAGGVKDDRVRDERVLVYSTDGTVVLPRPVRRKTQPVARAMPPLPDDALRQAQDDTIRVAREKRRNSAVTIVHGLAAGELEAAGKELRRLCGTGGTAKNGTVELQGDHRDNVVAYFEERGRRVKRAGG
jgi:translation initiation factor 1